MTQKSKFHYVAISPDRVEEHKEIGKAMSLHDFLVNHQTDAAGSVWYGKPISYAWIRSRWKSAPAERTLERHMARLKSCGLVIVTKLPFHQGMKIRLLRSAKWPTQPAQMGLFPADILSISRGKGCGTPAENVWITEKRAAKSGGAAPPIVAVKSSKKYREEKPKSDALADARFSPSEGGDLPDRRRILADQAEVVLKKFKIPGYGKGG